MEKSINLSMEYRTKTDMEYIMDAAETMIRYTDEYEQKPSGNKKPLRTAGPKGRTRESNTKLPRIV